MIEPKIIRNMIKCKKCGFILESHDRHDYVTHDCDDIHLMTDGGHDYIRRSANPEYYEELDVYSDAPFEVIRENLMRGTADKDNNRIYKKLSEMSNMHIAACIQYNMERGFGKEDVTEYYRQELKYRIANNVLIEDDYKGR